MELTAERVDAIFRDCLFREGEDTTGYVEADGIVHPVGFHPGRLKSHELEIAELLDELPDEFKKTGGGGWSFLNACMDKHGNQWGEHLNMEQLFQLGAGVGKVSLALPRAMWPILPGGMPYYVVDLGTRLYDHESVKKEPEPRV